MKRSGSLAARTAASGHHGPCSRRAPWPPPPRASLLGTGAPCAPTMSGDRSVWLGSIVVECREFESMVAFWSAALGYEAREPPTEDWVVLHDPAGLGPNLSLQKVGEGPGEEYRFHLDLYSSAPEQEVRRLIALGAVLREPKQGGRDLATLEDPDGNPFDVVWTPEFAFGQRSMRPTVPSSGGA